MDRNENSERNRKEKIKFDEILKMLFSMSGSLMVNIVNEEPDALIGQVEFYRGVGLQSPVYSTTKLRI